MNDLILKNVDLGAFQSVDVRSAHSAHSSRQTQVSEHVIKGAILHGYHHDVVDVRQSAGRKIKRRVGLPGRPAGRNSRLERFARAGVFDHKIVAHNSCVQHSASVVAFEHAAEEPGVHE